MNFTLDGLLNFLKQLASLNATGAVTIPLSGELNGSLTLTKDAQGHIGGSATINF